MIFTTLVRVVWLCVCAIRFKKCTLVRN